MNRDFIWAIIVIAKPSSPPNSLPLLDSAYWKRVVSPPSPLAKRARLGLENSNAALEETDTLNPNLLVGSPSTLTLTSYIGQGATCAAIRGTWHGAPIVVKFIEEQYSFPFVDEARVYLGGLAHLRGAVVPEFFGLYRSDCFALLVFEDCGDSISDWDGLDLQERCVHANIHSCDDYHLC
jgi:hypothetical protein